MQNGLKMKINKTFNYSLYISLAFSLFCCFSCSSNKNISLADKAAQEFNDGDLEQARKNYFRHMKKRLLDESRPNDENPFFYLVLIGDIYLKEEKLERAFYFYRVGHGKKVKTPLIAYRIRKVALAYHKNKQSEIALDILREYRELDEFAFDAEKDKIHREYINQLNNV